jgi:hypothetical protein
LLADGDAAPDHATLADHPPGDRRSPGRDAAVRLAGEQFEQLRTTDLPPGRRVGYRAAVVQGQRIGQQAVGASLGLVVVDGVGGGRVHAVDAGPQGLDPQQVEHAPVILLGGQRGRRRRPRAAAGDRQRGPGQQAGATVHARFGAALNAAATASRRGLGL